MKPDRGNRQAQQDFAAIRKAMEAGDLELLAEYALILDDFPDGRDRWHGGCWILHAVDFGSLEVLDWMIAQHVDLNVGDGLFSALHSAIDLTREDKYEVLSRLIAAGADVNIMGVAGGTPAHLAVWRGDYQALELLIAAGADLSIRTEVDNDFTPLEEARDCKASPEIIALLEAHGPAARPEI